MKDSISYKDCVIRGESFQREKNGTWIPQYTLTRPKTEGSGKESDFPSHQYQWNQAFPTESEAHEYAVKRAKEWIDAN